MVVSLEEFRHLFCSDGKKVNGSTLLPERCVRDSGVRRHNRMIQLDTRVPCYSPGLIGIHDNDRHIPETPSQVARGFCLVTLSHDPSSILGS